MSSNRFLSVVPEDVCVWHAFLILCRKNEFLSQRTHKHFSANLIVLEGFKKNHHAGPKLGEITLKVMMARAFQWSYADTPLLTSCLL